MHDFKYYPQLNNQYVGYILTKELDNTVIKTGIELYENLFPILTQYKGDAINVLIPVHHGNKITCYDKLKQWCIANNYLRYLDLDPYKLLGKDNRVICMDTGEIFENPNQACEQHKLSYGQLNKHLRGLIGYKSVKGKRYKKLVDTV